MVGPSREKIIKRRMEDLLDLPENIKDQGSKKGLDLIDTDDAVRIALLKLVITRRSEDWQNALDKIDVLRQRVISYQNFLDKEPTEPR